MFFCCFCLFVFDFDLLPTEGGLLHAKSQRRRRRRQNASDCRFKRRAWMRECRFCGEERALGEWGMRECRFWRVERGVRDRGLRECRFWGAVCARVGDERKQILESGMGCERAGDERMRGERMQILGVISV